MIPGCIESRLEHPRLRIGRWMTSLVSFQHETSVAEYVLLTLPSAHAVPCHMYLHTCTDAVKITSFPTQTVMLLQCLSILSLPPSSADLHGPIHHCLPPRLLPHLQRGPLPPHSRPQRGHPPLPTLPLPLRHLQWTKQLQLSDLHLCLHPRRWGNHRVPGIMRRE